MATRAKKFLEKKFKRLFQDWYQPKEYSTPAEVMVYEINARMIIKKVLKEFAILQ